MVMTKSFVRKGINLIRQFFRSEADMTLQVETTLVVLLRWIKKQIADYQHSKISRCAELIFFSKNRK